MIDKNKINVVDGNFKDLGYLILRNEIVSSQISSLRNDFHLFHKKFSNDIQKNRNIIKRFSDSFVLSRLFSSTMIYDIIIEFLKFKIPVFCGPTVSHYTSNDITGSSYGLPFHQDWPSMASSKNSAIMWFCLDDCNPDCHSISIIPSYHKKGLLNGKQNDGGYILNLPKSILQKEKILTINSGDILLMSSFLPHKTFLLN